MCKELKSENHDSNTVSDVQDTCDLADAIRKLENTIIQTHRRKLIDRLVIISFFISAIPNFEPTCEIVFEFIARVLFWMGV